jgi:hypothetical protein
MVAERKMAPPADPDVEQSAPFLWEMLTADAWADGTERILPQIVVERVPGAYRVSLKDDSLCIRKSCLVARWCDLISTLEKCLADPELPWESFKSYRNKGGPKVPGEKTPGRKKRR